MKAINLVFYIRVKVYPTVLSTKGLAQSSEYGLFEKKILSHD
jgi:hypothetical protein